MSKQLKKLILGKFFSCQARFVNHGNYVKLHTLLNVMNFKKGGEADRENRMKIMMILKTKKRREDW